MVSPILLILVPLATAFLIYILSGLPRFFSKSLAFLAIAFNAVLSFYLLLSKLPVNITIAGFKAPVGINLFVDHFSVVMLIIINVIGLLSLIYSLSYIENDKKSPKYYILFVLLMAGANGMMMTNDIFNLFVFFEIICLSSYLLVAYTQDKNALEAGLKYLIQGSVGSLLILGGIALLYMNLGTLNLSDIADRFQGLPVQIKVLITTFLFSGLCVEAAIFPFNSWLPDAHSSAPSSISALLSGFVIEIALLIIMRLAYSVLDGGLFFPILAGLGVLTLLIGEIAAFHQTNIKRALAFSSIGQVGLILFALSLGNQQAVSGGLMQVLNHALAKTALFLSVGFMIKQTGSYNYKDYKGIARKMPVSALVFVAGALSLIGVPPLFGFFSKTQIILSALKGGDALRLIEVALILTATVIEAAYFVRMFAVMYEKTGSENAKSAPFLPKVVLLTLLAGIALLFLVLPLVQQHVSRAAGDLLGRFSLTIIR